MFYDNELRFLQKMLTKCHLQNMTMDPNEPVDERLDKGLRNLFGVNGYSETFFDFFPDTRPNTVYRVADIFLCRYLFFMLPYCEKETVFIIGPYLNEDISRQQILEQGERMGISPKYYRELEFFYTALPVIKEEHYIFAMVHTFAEFLWSGADRYESVDINRESSAAFITHHLEPRVPSEGSSLNIQAMESRYDFENQLMMAVSQGNLHKAELMMTHFSTLAFENRTPDPLRNMKNYCIIMNTLLRKAAEQGGVHPVQLDSVSSDFARRIEQLRSVAVVTGFMREILQTYCNLVKRHSVRSYSPPVQKAMVKIDSDLTADLSLRAMAELTNVTPGYFSGLFKKETGQTLTEYVNGKRMAFAKHLLKSTNLQIQTIAQHCGILDFHYFCRMFKKTVGKTPSEYRSSVTFH